MEKNGTEGVTARSSVASGENQNGQSSSDIIKELYEMPLEELQELARKEREEAEETWSGSILRDISVESTQDGSRFPYLNCSPDSH